MFQLPQKLQRKLETRVEANSLRKLSLRENFIDFSSNDYLGLSASEAIFNRANKILEENNLKKNGSTGSRLLSGNNQLFEETEQLIASIHNSEKALLFNSGYDANVGFFSCVPQRNDIIFYDELVHASIHDGIRMSNAKGIKFKHNNLADLELKLKSEISKNPENTILYVVTETVFSMDGDGPDLEKFIDFCTENNCYLILDEAHGIGVSGKNGLGVVADLGLEKKIFARLVTFGKAMGCHGAAILGSKQLQEYLLNFARSFIYTTSLPPHSVATIKAAYIELFQNKNSGLVALLHSRIAFFKVRLIELNIESSFNESDSAIQSCIIPGNERVKEVSTSLLSSGFEVKAILSPTVPEGSERLRICLHSYNSEAEIKQLLLNLKSCF